MYETRGDRNRLQISELTCPDAFHWPSYIWTWNDRITRDEIARQLEDMRDCGAMGVWVLTFPNFRPDFNPSAMEPDYLSEEFMDLYRFYVEKAGELGMKVWLYDEGGWPSGSANGRIVAERPELAEQSLRMTELTPDVGETVTIPDDALSAFIYRGDEKLGMLRAGDTTKIDFAEARIEVYISYRHDRTFASVQYPDPLNPETTREFIRLTHEAFWERMGECFGSVVPLVFTDEPRASNPPWTDGLVDDFQHRYGYDITEHLPAIIKADDDEGAAARVDFYDWWTDRYAKSFFKPIRDWCEAHDLFFSGHFGGEDYTLGARNHGFGHPTRLLRELDIPGVDTIWRQLYPGKPTTIEHKWGTTESRLEVNNNHHFPKLASSVAHQGGKRWAVTESFAVYGSGLDPARMKWITDFQYVRGINLEVVSNTYFSTRDFFMGHPRPMFQHSNPLQKHMRVYHEYVARLSYLLSLGEASVETAVYYPVRDIWAGGSDVEKVAESHDRLAAALLECQCDFDLLDDDMLEIGTTRVEDSVLVVGPMKYHSIFVSMTAWMSEESKVRLREFAARGGKLFWVDVSSEWAKPEMGKCIEASEVADYVRPLVSVQPVQSMIRVCKRSLSNGNLYFVTNEDTEPVSCRLEFSEQSQMAQCDIETGRLVKPLGARHTPSGCSIDVDLPFAGSRVFFFSDEDLPLSEDVGEPGESVLSLDGGWSTRKIWSYRVGEHDLEIEELSGEEPLPVLLGDWRDALGPEFSGDAEYVCRFTCGRDDVNRVDFLDLGTVRSVCEVSLNGINLGKRAWEPYRFPITGLAHEGENKLRVVVTNTMANQYTTTKNLDKWPENVIGPYHKIALTLEQDSVSSGLFGPVQLRTRRD